MTTISNWVVEEGRQKKAEEREWRRCLEKSLWVVRAVVAPLNEPAQLSVVDERVKSARGTATRRETASVYAAAQLTQPARIAREDAPTTY